MSRIPTTTARARAAKLVRDIERAIEAGEFTPVMSYLWLKHDLIGPCGCAIAAAAQVRGYRGDEAFVDKPELLAFLSSAGALSEPEALALEAGYEGFEALRDRPYDATFYAAGAELRKFHPYSTVTS